MNDRVPPSSPQHSGEDLLPAGLRGIFPMMAVVGFAFTLVCFLLGIREPRKSETLKVPYPQQVVKAPPAPSYAEISTANIGPNANRQGSLSQLKFDKPGIYDTVTRTGELKLAALADRARNRAFDGAPPTIPHPAQPRSDASCLSCHHHGLIVGNRVASPICHPHLPNCTQCHVEQASIPANNAFVGLDRAGPGERLSPGAPPSIPHRTWMRENCASCHGLIARPGLRTTHPWLTNCTQCHASQAALDQIPFLEVKR